MGESPLYGPVTERDKERGREFIKKRSIEQGMEQGIEQGAKKATIEIIVLLLDTRFEVDAAESLKPALEAIDDLACLKYLLHCLIRALK